MFLKFLLTATLSCLPLCLIAPALAQIAFGWIQDYGGEIRPGAFVAGYEGDRPLYLCRTHKGDDVHPGKLVGNYCNISWGGWEYLSGNYELLIVPSDVRLVWKAASNGQLPPGAVVGGTESGQSLYVCRAQYKNGIHPGKVVGRNCNFGWGGREIVEPKYEVLVLEDS